MFTLLLVWLFSSSQEATIAGTMEPAEIEAAKIV
jgi:hypothetical protein